MKMFEEVKRLTPLSGTLRELFLKSGNLCAFPECANLIMNSDGVFIAQICHIEAAEKGGERFNPCMTNEDRRRFDNLMLMCHEHHKVTNDVSVYTVDRLKNMKLQHELRFSDPGRVIFDSIKDWTVGHPFTKPRNMNGLYPFCWGTLDDVDKVHYLNSVTTYIDKFQSVPLELRVFLGRVVARMQRVKNTAVVIKHGWSERAIALHDLVGAFRMPLDEVLEYGNRLQFYAVASIDEKDDWGVGCYLVFALHEVSDWPFWSDLALYCEATGQSIDTFAVNMDFAMLDA
ncbi:hypothetical protein [Pseudomonas moraviensis]